MPLGKEYLVIVRRWSHYTNYQSFTSLELSGNNSNDPWGDAQSRHNRIRTAFESQVSRQIRWRLFCHFGSRSPTALFGKLYYTDNIFLLDSHLRRICFAKPLGPNITSPQINRLIPPKQPISISISVNIILALRYHCLWYTVTVQITALKWWGRILCAMLMWRWSHGTGCRDTRSLTLTSTPVIDAGTLRKSEIGLSNTLSISMNPRLVAQKIRLTSPGPGPSHHFLDAWGISYCLPACSLHLSRNIMGGGWLLVPWKNCRIKTSGSRLMWFRMSERLAYLGQETNLKMMQQRPHLRNLLQPVSLPIKVTDCRWSVIGVRYRLLNISSQGLELMFFFFKIRTKKLSKLLLNPACNRVRSH
jgi:hypothetical protein